VSSGYHFDPMRRILIRRDSDWQLRRCVFSSSSWSIPSSCSTYIVKRLRANSRSKRSVQPHTRSYCNGATGTTSTDTGTVTGTDTSAGPSTTYCNLALAPLALALTALTNGMRRCRVSAVTVSAVVLLRLALAVVATVGYQPQYQPCQ
jgi:hypothetical protein